MYRWLLRLYPASFRNEYGREMAAVFARERRDTRTALSMAALWLRVIADACVNAAGIHWDILRQDLRYTLRTLRRTPASRSVAAGRMRRSSSEPAVPARRSST